MQNKNDKSFYTRKKPLKATPNSNELPSVSVCFEFECKVFRGNQVGVEEIFFAEEVEYISSAEFDWLPVVEYCQAHKRTVEFNASKDVRMKDFECRMYLRPNDVQSNPILITKNNSLRLMKRQVKDFFAKYGLYVDKKSSLSYFEKFDNILDAGGKPEYPAY